MCAYARPPHAGIARRLAAGPRSPRATSTTRPRAAICVDALDARADALAGNRPGDEHDPALVARQHASAGDGTLDVDREVWRGRLRSLVTAAPAIGRPKRSRSSRSTVTSSDCAPHVVGRSRARIWRESATASASIAASIVAASQPRARRRQVARRAPGSRGGERRRDRRHARASPARAARRLLEQRDERVAEAPRANRAGRRPGSADPPARSRCLRERRAPAISSAGSAAPPPSASPRSDGATWLEPAAPPRAATGRRPRGRRTRRTPAAAAVRRATRRDAARPSG